jgi:hypothetical protein
VNVCMARCNNLIWRICSQAISSAKQHSRVAIVDAWGAKLYGLDRQAHPKVVGISGGFHSGICRACCQLTCSLMRPRFSRMAMALRSMLSVYMWRPCTFPDSRIRLHIAVPCSMPNLCNTQCRTNCAIKTTDSVQMVLNMSPDSLNTCYRQVPAPHLDSLIIVLVGLKSLEDLGGDARLAEASHALEPTVGRDGHDAWMRIRSRWHDIALRVHS